MKNLADSVIDNILKGKGNNEYLNWLYYDDRLEEGENKCDQPIVGLACSPFH